MKHLLQAVFYLLLAGVLLFGAYEYFALYQRFAVERRDKELAQSNETSIRMQRDQLLVYVEELTAALGKCVSPVVYAEEPPDVGNPMPGFAREDQFSGVQH